MNVLSLFDGMSCGRIALDLSNIKVNWYGASEVDKYATQVSEKNYPDIERLGDVTLWDFWNIDWKSIDLVIAGSPCQGFSFAGKQLAFDDYRSKLFFTFVDILNHIRSKNPNVKFLLENVRMKKEFQDIISDFVGVQPVMINSSLLSAQNRVRLYWANWDFKQPEDKGILIQDIILNAKEVEDKYIYKKEYTYTGNKIGHVANLNIKGHDLIKRIYSIDGKCPTLNTCQGGNLQAKVIVRVKEATKKGYVDVPKDCGVDLTFPSSKTSRGRLMHDKRNCLTAPNYDYCWNDGCIVTTASITIKKL